MESERRNRSLERHQASEQRKPIFDLEQLEPEPTAELIAIIGAQYDYLAANNEPGAAEDFIGHLEDDLAFFAQRSDKALDTYLALMNYSGSAWPCHLALISMAIPLIERNVDKLAARQQIITPWLNSLHHDDAAVQDSAQMKLCKLVYSDVLDEPTARLLDSQIPEVTWRRWQ